MNKKEMFLSLCRVIARKLLVRKGRLIVALCLFLLGVLGTFYFRTTDSNVLVSEPARTIRVVSSKKVSGGCREGQ